MERAVLVYTTFPSIVEAEQAGRELVQRRLCACVNILPGMVSLYWWEGAIERGGEVGRVLRDELAADSGGQDGFSQSLEELVNGSESSLSGVELAAIGGRSIKAEADPCHAPTYQLAVLGRSVAQRDVGFPPGRDLDAGGV